MHWRSGTKCSLMIHFYYISVTNKAILNLILLSERSQ